MPSFQSPVPISGRPCAPTREAAVERARAVLEERARCSSETRGCEVRLVLASARAARPSRNGTASSSTAASPVDLEVVRDGVGQPEQVVGDARAHAAARRRVPPVLHVALDELPRRGAQEVLARELGLRHGERHHVLQLVAEAVGAARLVERRARPDAAGERLIEQPAVEQQVHRRDRASSPARRRGRRPSASSTASQHRVEVGGAVARDQRARLRRRCAASPSRNDDLGALAGRELDASSAARAHGIEPGADAARERLRRARAPPGGRACRCGRGTRCGRRSTRVCAPAEVGERDALAELAVPRVARQQRAGVADRSR